MRLLFHVVLVLGIALTVFAQQSDLARLRELFGGTTRYSGSAVQSETYTIQPGVAMLVEYRPSGKMCKLTIPDKQASKEQIDAILDEAIPPSIRGKQWSWIESYTGIAGSQST